ncbi:MAG: hypothetical protein ACLRMN_09105 [Mediterraneibacter gnavus]
MKVVAATDYYEYNKEYDLWKDKRDDKAYMKELIQKGEELEIVGIVRPKEDASAAMLTSGLYYPSELVEYVSECAADSEIVKATAVGYTAEMYSQERALMPKMIQKMHFRWNRCSILTGQGKYSLHFP